VHSPRKCERAKLGNTVEDPHPFEKVCEFLSGPGIQSNTDIETAKPWLENIFLRPWHDCLWVLQEAVLAPKALMLLGRMSLPLHKIHAMAQRIYDATEICIHHRQVYFTTTKTLALGYLSERLARNVRSATIDIPLSSLVISAVGRICSDPRDKIYGLAGILDRVGLNIEVDYQKSMSAVFQKFSEQLVLMNADAWMFCHTFFGGSETAGIPSWALDFTRTNGASFNNTFYSSGGSKESIRCRVDTDSEKVVFFGTELGRVQAISQAKPSTHDLDEFRLWLTQLENLWHKHVCSQSVYRDWTGAREALARTIVGDIRSSPSERRLVRRISAIESQCVDLEISLGRASPMLTSRSDKTQLELVARNVMWRYYGDTPSGMVIFFTEHGHIGSSRAHTRKGDRVVLVPGLSALIMLREKADQGTFELIGGAYIHGVMDGEALQDENRMEQEYNIY